MKIKKAKMLITALLVMAMIMNTGCSKNNPLNPLGCGTGTWALQVADEASAWSLAASTYGNDPSPANCQSYKNAGISYLDALEGVRGCVAGVSQAEFNEAIAEAKQDVEEADCDG